MQAMHRIARRRWSLILGSVLALALPAFSQHASGTVNGTITDTTGSVIPGADVTLTNVETNVVARAKTNSSGYFTFVDVTPGQYTMTIIKAGFKKIVLPLFHLVVNQTLTENESLTVGAEAESITVNAAAEGVMLQRSSSELGNVIESKEIQNLPLNGRNFTQLLILSPGVNPSPPRRAQVSAPPTRASAQFLGPLSTSQGSSASRTAKPFI